ncbi:hypothetical protein Q6D67_18660 [Haliea sp. E1-2-M8]|uniref:ComEC/Rec2 family competence protein n=1 Tax=Haliea sp. E1-2-M8 TaxID=3064706 RepID=UPI00271759B8|nr:hypothetical protein [Haliea sp. E1-2-M8]MDO8863718.1 hypothetical protein [Haliea sp. E1-2-M8]
MLDVWILNAGKGDSIVLRYCPPSRSPVYALIDSNVPTGKSEPPALPHLKMLGAEKLAFVLLTHPHADHYMGLYRVLCEFEVEQFYSYPIGLESAGGNLKKLAEKYLRYTTNPSETVRAQSVEFVRLLQKVHTSGILWGECAGPKNRLYVDGAKGLEIDAILPFRKQKGAYFDAIRKGTDSVVANPHWNNLSVALQITYGHHKIILGADGTFQSWFDHRRQLLRVEEKLEGGVVKLPHHGAKADCNDSVLEYLFSGDAEQERIALISANGNPHHPDKEVLLSLKQRGIKPYCTNLSTMCGGQVARMRSIPSLPVDLRRFVNFYADPSVGTDQPCQGAIQVTFASGCSHVDVSREYSHPCALRGDYDHVIARN